MQKSISEKGKIDYIISSFIIFLIATIVLHYFVIQNNSFTYTTIRVMEGSIIWIVIASIINRNLFLEVINHYYFLWIILYLCFVFLVSYYYYDITTAITNILVRVALFVGMFLFVYVCGIKNVRLKNYLGIATISIWIIACCKMLILYKHFPGIAIARDIASFTADASIIESIGSPYAIAQGLCLNAIALFYVAYDNQIHMKKRFLLLLYGIVILFTVCIIRTQSTITILTEIIFISIIFLFSRIKKKINVIITIVVLFIIILLANNYIGFLLMKTFNSNENWVSIRLYEIGMFLCGDGVSADIDSRINLALKSISTFLDHPFVGNLYSSKYGYVSGNHSELLDVFSDYGLLGGIPFIMSIAGYYKFISKKLEIKTICVWLPLFITAIFNPISLNQCYFAAFFTVPLIFNLAMSYSSLHKEDGY